MGMNVSGSGDPSQPGFLPKVEAKLKEIKNSSIFESFPTTKNSKGELKKLDYLNEAAFINVLFDTNEDGNYSEYDAEVSKEEYNAKIVEYNKANPNNKLELGSYEEITALMKQLNKDINCPKNRLFKIAMDAAVQISNKRDKDIQQKLIKSLKDIKYYEVLEKRGELNDSLRTNINTIRTRQAFFEKPLSQESIDACKIKASEEYYPIVLEKYNTYKTSKEFVPEHVREFEIYEELKANLEKELSPEFIESCQQE